MADRRGRRWGSPSGGPRFPRTLRVNHLLQEVVAEEIERLGDDDPRLALVTVTGVKVDPDLRHATVWLSSLSEEASEALGEDRVRLQAAIGRQVRMKRTPQLTFAADPAGQPRRPPSFIVEPPPGTADDLELGLGPDEALAGVEHLLDVRRRGGHHRHGHPGPLPQILVFNLGHRHGEAAPQPLDQGLQHGSLRLERARRGYVQVDFEHGDVGAHTRQVRGISRSS